MKIHHSSNIDIKNKNEMLLQRSKSLQHLDIFVKIR